MIRHEALEYNVSAMMMFSHKISVYKKIEIRADIQ